MDRISDRVVDGLQPDLMPRASAANGTTSDRAVLAPLIAIIGCDGAGKSTVGAHVLAFVRDYCPATTAHLGKQSGNLGRALAHLPLIGTWIGRAIRRKSEHVRNHRSKNKRSEEIGRAHV